MNGQPFVPMDPMKDMTGYQGDSADNMIAFTGFSGLHLHAPYIGTETTQNHARIGPYNNNTIDMGTGSFYDGSPIELPELPFYCPYESTGSRRHDISMVNSFTEQLNYLVPKEDEVASTESYMNMHTLKQMNTYPVQEVKLEEPTEPDSFFNCKSSASNVDSRRFSKTYQRRSRSSEMEYNRRALINEKTRELQELLTGPFKPKRGNDEAILDNATAYIKYLQLQLKELSRIKLGGGSHTAPLSYLEGYGHYHPEEKLMREPLEKEIGSLILEDQTATSQLLENKGLHMMPVTSVDALRCSL